MTGLLSTALKAALVLAVALLAILTSPAVEPARAGEWVQDSCVNPDGSAAGSEGWSAMIAGGGYGSTTGSSCGPASPAFALLSTDAGVPVGSAETLRYSPAAGSSLIGGSADVAMHADGYGYDASGTAVAYTPEYSYDAANVFFQCAAGLAPCSGAGSDYAGAITLPSDRGGQLYLSAGCGGEPGASCDEGGSLGAWALVQLYWARLHLRNDATPAASGFAGTLLGAEARASSELAFTASDPGGPGIYRVLVQADGETLYTGTPDNDAGRCVAVGSEGAALMFDSSQPCRETEPVSLTLDTTGLRDGTHTLKVSLIDAAGNQATVLDQRIDTRNAPEALTPPSLTEPQVTAGGAASVRPGSWTAPAGAGALGYSYQWQQCQPGGDGCVAIPGAQGATYTPSVTQAGLSLRALVTVSDHDGASTIATGASSPVAALTPDVANGISASEHSELTLTGPPRVSRGFARRGLTLTGQLTGADHAPVADATLELLSQTAENRTPVTVGYLTTSPDGTFTAHVPAGPSRRITLAYRAFSADAGYAATASIFESVSAGVTLSVTPHRSSSSGTIVLSGRVAGPIPPGGVKVELLVHYRRRWEPFREPETRPDGRFLVRYHFEGATGTFPFRARVPGGQSGFPYAAGSSASVQVRTH